MFSSYLGEKKGRVTQKKSLNPKELFFFFTLYITFLEQNSSDKKYFSIPFKESCLIFPLKLFKLKQQIKIIILKEVSLQSSHFLPFPIFDFFKCIFLPRKHLQRSYF